MLFLKSLVFNLCFFIVTLFLSIFGLIAGVIYRKSFYKVAYFWGIGVSFLLKHICRITYEIQGSENIPHHPRYIFACKHQSAWETVMFQVLCYQSCIIVKRELFWIPIFGQVLYLSNAIGLNRKKGKDLLPLLLKKAQYVIDKQQPLFIFPEGTRSTAGHHGHYKRGIGQLYSHLNIPVVPAALNSGFYWPRRGFIKYPGHIVVKILPAIQPGLKIQDFINHLSSTIEEACFTLPKSIN